MKIRLHSDSGMVRLPSSPGTPNPHYMTYFPALRRSTILRLLAIAIALAVCYSLIHHSPLESARGASIPASRGGHARSGATMPGPKDGVIKQNLADNTWARASVQGAPGVEVDDVAADTVQKELAQDHVRTHAGPRLPVKNEDKGKTRKESDIPTSPGGFETTGAAKIALGMGSGLTGTFDYAPGPEDSFEVSPLTGTMDHFKRALRAVLEAEPDEIHIRDLLEPLKSSGLTSEGLMRELGLRTRAFSKYFRLWEALHFISDEVNTVVRDDVVQFLRRTPDISDLSSMSRTEMIRSYENYRFFVTRLSDLLFPWIAPYFANHMTLHAHFRHGGRGIVISGNDRETPYVVTLIKSIRKLGSTLPVEIMYLGDEDLGEDSRARLESIPGVTTRDLEPMITAAGWDLQGWAVKPFAMLMSSFREVLFLDADSLYFVNPETFFEDPNYVETGALFFKDRIYYHDMERKTLLKNVLPKPISKKAQTSRFWHGTSREQQESGCIVVDKWRHFVAMLLVARMNGPDREDNEATGAKGIYSLFYGDKETFWLGWELAGDTDYHFHEGGQGALGEQKEVEVEMVPRQREPLVPVLASEAGEQQDMVERRKYTVDSSQLLHLDLNGRPLWFNGWLLQDKWEDQMGPLVQFDMFVNEQNDFGEIPAWHLGGHNTATLISDIGGNLTAEERGVLDMIIFTARENGAVRQGP